MVAESRFLSEANQACVKPLNSLVSSSSLSCRAGSAARTRSLSLAWFLYFLGLSSPSRSASSSPTLHPPYLTAELFFTARGSRFLQAVTVFRHAADLSRFSVKGGLNVMCLGVSVTMRGNASERPVCLPHRS